MDCRDICYRWFNATIVATNSDSKSSSDEIEENDDDIVPDDVTDDDFVLVKLELIRKMNLQVQL